MVSPIIGQAIAVGTSLLRDSRVWSMRNLDTNEVLAGQFEAVGLTENVSANWEQHTSLNRKSAITQFINKSNDTLSFGARFFRDSITGDPLLGGAPLIGEGNPLGKLEVLKLWSEPDPRLRRPPILEFWVGDGHIQMTCVISNLSDITYGRPDYFGGFRDVSLTIDLLQFTPFSLDDEGETDTRYARAKARDYYELLAFEEYNNPLLGDVIRKDHPDQQLLAEGNIVKLPSIEGVRNKEVTQRSIPLAGGFGRKDTPQKSNVQRFFDLRSDSYVSHILQPSTKPT